jgi:hypothetical protein
MSSTVKFSIISPPGSGTTFAANLLYEYLENSTYSVYHHDYKSFNKNVFDVSILRDPYESIASHVELTINKLLSPDNIKNDVKFFNQLKYQTKDTLSDIFNSNIKDYKDFLNSIKEEQASHALICTFEFVTKTPEKFLIEFSNKFNVEIKDFNKNLIQDSVINRMKDGPGKTRFPREKTAIRKIIDKNIREYEPMKDLFAEYQKQLEKENINGNARA